MSAAIQSDSITPARSQRRAVGIWLLCIAAIILCMVTIGGLTRLTGSGLSITHWKPVTGVVPPLSDTVWRSEFDSYKHIPQYRLENHGMSLGDFKAIYWWEWTHRFLGRLLGFVFLLPFLSFVWRGAIGRRDIPRMTLLFALGGLQGFIGWWMVQSGLETRVSVSQYRLAIHLGTAIIILGATVWIALEYLTKPYPPLEGGSKRSGTLVNDALRGGVDTVLPLTDISPREISASPSRGEAKGAVAFAALVYVQMLLGALVAGLHGGLLYNTWPSMNGRAMPEDAFALQPWWRNFFENPGMAQFDHRIGAYIVFASAIALWLAARRNDIATRSATAVLQITLLQVVLGIATLLLQAPVILSALHQLTAALLFCAALWLVFETRTSTAKLSSAPG